MSSPDELRVLPGGEPPPAAPRGCLATLGSLGLAFYALLVLGMGCTGLLCMGGVAALQLLGGGGAPTDLQAGASLPRPTLEALRDAGIVPRGALPDAIHLDDPFAGSGCLVLGSELVRWEGGRLVSRLPLPGTEVRLEGSPRAPSVAVRGEGAEIRCPFGAGEGGERFARMLRAEARRSLPASPPPD